MCRKSCAQLIKMLHAGEATSSVKFRTVLDKSLELLVRVMYFESERTKLSNLCIAEGITSSLMRRTISEIESRCALSAGLGNQMIWRVT